MTNFLSTPSTPAEAPRRWPLIKISVSILLVLAIIGGIFLVWKRHNVLVRLTLLGERVQEKLVAGDFLWHSRQPPPVAVIPMPPRPVRKPEVADIDLNRFSAQHLIVKDAATGEMLLDKLAYEPWPLASVTKLLSALVLLDIPVNLATTTLTATDTVFDVDIAQHEDYQTSDLWQAALIASSNRAVLSLADSTGLPRSDFVAKMNAKAHELGMVNTHVVEPTGLDPRNTATASDAALLVHEAMRHPEISQTVLKKDYALNSIDRKYPKTLHNTDWLVLGIIHSSNLEIRGAKTGYIPESDYNFVLETANQQGRVIDVVVLGTSSNDARFVEARDAALWAFSAYSWGDVVTSTTSTLQK